MGGRGAMASIQPLSRAATEAVVIPDSKGPTDLMGRTPITQEVAVEAAAPEEERVAWADKLLARYFSAGTVVWGVSMATSLAQHP
jgi:hypothetical protein